MGIRKFMLINSIGETFDLNSLNHFMHDPDGLGYESGADYIQVGNVFNPISDKPRQIPISGVIRFKKPDCYEKYMDFIRFCQRKPLTMVYTTMKEYRCAVNLASIKKTEVNLESGMDVPVRFAKLGTWYRKVFETNENHESEGKKYSYQYPFTYADEIANAIVIDSDSCLESPTKITIFGHAVNPTWRHYLNGKLAEVGKVNATIEQGKKLVIDTTNAPSTIQEQDRKNQPIRDLYQDSDFATERFVYFGIGRNRIVVGHEGTQKLVVSVEAQIAYETV